MEYQLSYHLKIGNFDLMSYWEFLWKYERLMKQLQEEQMFEGMNGVPLESLINRK